MLTKFSRILSSPMRGAFALVGKASGVDRKADTYAGFYVTKIEIANKDTLDPVQLQALQKKFPGKTFYVVTAVQEEWSRDYHQRSFIVSDTDIPKLQLEDRVTFTTLGQYRRPFFKTYPVVQSFEIEKPKSYEMAGRMKRQMASIDNARELRMVKTGMVFKRFADIQPALP